MTLRVVLVSQILPVVVGFHETITSLGHDQVAFLTIVDREQRYEGFGLDLRDVPAGVDILSPARRSSIAPLLRAAEPDLVVCMGFPWKIPADALAVPKLGWLNGHPSLLPRHRGPNPVAWAIRAGDAEIGITFHGMDTELDTGPIFAQRPYPLGELESPDSFYPRMVPFVLETLIEALGRIEAGETGEEQSEGGEYETFFSEDDAWLDLARPAVEVHRLAWAWRYAVAPGITRGALLELDGKTVRVLATSLTEVAGAWRVECGDGPLWIVETEELSEAEASLTSARAASTQ